MVTSGQPTVFAVVIEGVCANCPPPQYKPSKMIPDGLAKTNCSPLFVKIPTSDTGPEVQPQVPKSRFIEVPELADPTTKKPYG